MFHKFEFQKHPGSLCAANDKVSQYPFMSKETCRKWEKYFLSWNPLKLGDFVKKDQLEFKPAHLRIRKACNGFYIIEAPA